MPPTAPAKQQPTDNVTGDSRFYAHCGPFSVQEIAAAVGGTTTGLDRQISGLAPLNAAGATDVSFINSKRYLASLSASEAGAVIVAKALAPEVPAAIDAIICADPDAAWAKASALFHPKRLIAPGVHATANVAADAMIDPSAEIGAFACVESGAMIGPDCRIGAYSFIGPGVQLGAG